MGVRRMTLRFGKRFAFLCGLIPFLAILGMPPAKATQYTYNVDFPLLINATAGYATITGTIVTTCDNACPLNSGDISSWVFFVPGYGEISSDLYAQPVQVNGTSPLVAGPSLITLNPQGQQTGNIVFDDSVPTGHGGYLNFFFIFRQFPADGASIQLFENSQPYLFETFMGSLDIAFIPPPFLDCFQVDDCRPIQGLELEVLDLLFVREDKIVLHNEHVSATPLPAALPVFVTGLGCLGVLGWRRKRRSAA
jgi:hypothetical protein